MLLQDTQSLKILRSYHTLIRTVREKVERPDLKLIKKAFRFALRAHRKQKRLSGEPYIIHPIAVAQTLSDRSLDSITIAAALLHDVVEDTEYGEDTIQDQFGEEVNSLVKGVTKISAVKKKSAQIATLSTDNSHLRAQKEKEAAENIRLMLLATAKDVRVILIKLADKLHNMQTLDFQRPEKVQRIANETLNIYAPLAARLGMYRIKAELEDLAFARLEPEEYQKIRDEVSPARLDLDGFIQTIRTILQQRLTEINIKGSIEGRAKHAHSIYRKMATQGKGLDEIYDILGVRIILPEIKDCYGTLGIVHSIWPPIPGRFKDYIATPKVNGYQSLHTAVVGPDGRAMEVQIRTENMDEMADYGIAAHWIYKNQPSLVPSNPRRFNWLKRLPGLAEDQGEEGVKDFLEDLRQELSLDEVYVFTPKGDIIDLPHGATVLDFAFRIHTEIGLRCRGTRVNDRIVPLRTELKSGDRVEVLTNKAPNPSPNWLRYIKSYKSRQKLKAYLRKKEEEERNETNEQQQKKELQDALESQNKSEQPQEIRIRRRKTPDPKQVPIEVAGATDIPVRYAGCCTPVPGDRIVGFITRGRGVTVHRKDCPHLRKNETEKDRFIIVRWEGLTEKYPVRIEVKARDRQGLIRDLVDGITGTHTNILKAEADIPKTADDLAWCRFQIEVEHVDHLRDVIEHIESVPGVVSVSRTQEK